MISTSPNARRGRCFARERLGHASPRCYDGSVRAELDDARREDADTQSSDGTATDVPEESTWAPIKPLRPQRHDAFTLMGCIATGGQGEIWQAYDERLHRTVALKIVRHGASQDRFRGEIELTARLTHPSIATLYSSGVWLDGRPFYAMPFVKGAETLHDVVLRHDDLGTRLLLLDAVLDVCRAISYAHSKDILHRDLKPANILLGEYGRAMVIDWGLAVPFDRTQGDPVGTPPFAAPEQAAGSPCDERTDVYALGAILYFIVARRPPFPTDVTWEVVASNSPRPVVAHEPTPPDLAAIIAKALQRDPAARYPTAEELREDLVRFLRGERVAARPVSRIGKSWQVVYRGSEHLGKLLLAVTAVALLLALQFEQLYDVAKKQFVDRTRAQVASLAGYAAAKFPGDRIPAEEQFTEITPLEDGTLAGTDIQLCMSRAGDPGIMELTRLLKEILDLREGDEQLVGYVWLMTRGTDGADGFRYHFLADADLRRGASFDHSERPSCPGELFAEAAEFRGLERAFTLEPLTATSDESFDMPDPWGVTMSGYGPVRDSHGDVVAILGVDARKELVKALEDRRRSGRIATFLVWALAVLSLLVLARIAEQHKNLGADR